MPEFLPIVATQYNTDRVRMQSVVAPPYDVISREEQEVLYLKDAHNVVRLILNHDKDTYRSAAEYFAQWHSEGVLVEDSSPAFFVYYQTFRNASGKFVTRTGVLGRLKLSSYDQGEVRPHERTMPGPKRDRLELMEAVSANLSPIFGLVNDPTLLFDHTLEVATVNPPLADVHETLANEERVRHTVWRLDDPMAVKRIEAIVRAQPITIADGHHRYETSLAYRDKHPESKAAQYVLTYLTNLHGEGTVILPTHRMLHGVPEFDALKFLDKLRSRFSLEIAQTRNDALDILEKDRSVVTVIELPEAPDFVIVRSTVEVGTSALERLPVMRLQEEILKPFVPLSQAAIDEKTNLFYPHTVAEADAIRSATAVQATFYLRAVTPQEMYEIVEEGAFMPQKSTFFFPKLLSGLVFHEFAAQK